MTDLTPERIRDAAEVVRAFSVPPHVWTGGEHDGMARAAILLDNIAVRREREQAEEAKRDKRIKQLTNELIEMTYGWDPMPSVSHMRSMNGLAVQLLDRYPALADGPADE
ncbi:hypothetical protein A5722_14710 [Mycobacterium vulneris]|nr:hypothetical protein A5722_14710 [Mycolicibacterium vulneris]OCB66180.1 hypothetical protein A5729_12215 [Mycolicibacterium vulneris]